MTSVFFSLSLIAWCSHQSFEACYDATLSASYYGAWLGLSQRLSQEGSDEIFAETAADYQLACIAI
jgi:hypothetical protein